MEINSGFYAVIGILIGATITQLSNFFQQKRELKKDQIRIAYEMAVKEYDTLIKNSKPGTKVVPLEIFVTYYIQFFKKTRKKNFTITDMQELDLFKSDLMDYANKKLK
ncbi:MAG: hypothetical protein AB8B78_00655 [Polaribacter sp.]